MLLLAVKSGVSQTQRFYSFAREFSYEDTKCPPLSAPELLQLTADILLLVIHVDFE